MRIETAEGEGTVSQHAYTTFRSDEMDGLPEWLRKSLIDRGLCYMTKLTTAGGMLIGGTVIAKDEAQAKKILEGRDMNEEVVGLIYGYDE